MKSCIIFILLLSISSFSYTQESNETANYPGKWIFTNDNLSNEWYAERFYTMNAIELQKYHSTTEKLVNYFQKQPIAQKPLGVTLNVKARAAYHNYDHDLYPVKSTERVKAEVFIPFCSLYYVNNKIEFNCDEVSYIDIICNDEFQVYEPAMNYDILDDKNALNQFKEIFFLPAKLLDLGNGVYLYNWYYKNRVVVARNDRPFWIPVTNKEYIERMMSYYTASLKEGKIIQFVMDELKKEIAGIPEEMMNLPAFLNQNSERPLTSICNSNENSASALYKFNPFYFDKTLPRTYVQLITISIEGNADNPDWGGINAKRVWEYIQGLKGDELSKLLDVK